MFIFVEKMEELGLAPLVDLLASLGRWPMTVANWTADQFDWQSATVKLRADLGVGYGIVVFLKL